MTLKQSLVLSVETTQRKKLEELGFTLGVDLLYWNGITRNPNIEKHDDDRFYQLSNVYIVIANAILGNECYLISIKDNQMLKVTYSGLERLIIEEFGLSTQQCVCGRAIKNLPRVADK